MYWRRGLVFRAFHLSVPLKILVLTNNDFTKWYNIINFLPWTCQLREIEVDRSLRCDLWPRRFHWLRSSWKNSFSIMTTSKTPELLSPTTNMANSLSCSWFSSEWVGLRCMCFFFSSAGLLGRLLKNWVDPLARSDKNKLLEEQTLSSVLARAVITCHSKLTPNYEYIAKKREENKQKSLATKKKMKHPKEFDPNNSIMQYNVKKVKDIQGEALDFSW